LTRHHPFFSNLFEPFRCAKVTNRHPFALCHTRSVSTSQNAFAFIYFTKASSVRLTAQHDGGVGSMTTIATSAAVTWRRCATTPAPSSRTARRVASASPLASPVGTSSRLNGPHRTRRSPAPPAALPPFLDTIPAFLANPSPGLVPAAAANTAVFTGGIKVLLKGLTWPGVINSWFLGTVRVA
jgi:hypothetical protein